MVETILLVKSKPVKRLRLCERREKWLRGSYLNR